MVAGSWNGGVCSVLPAWEAPPARGMLRHWRRGVRQGVRRGAAACGRCDAVRVRLVLSRRRGVRRGMRTVRLCEPAGIISDSE